MLKTLIHKLRTMHKSPRPEENRQIEQYINAYHTFLNGTGEITLDCLEDIHRATSSSLHSGAATDDIMVSAFLYSALRLPGCLDQVSRMIIGPSERIFSACGYGKIDSWKQPRHGPDGEKPCSTEAKPWPFLSPAYRTLMICCRLCALIKLNGTRCTNV